MLYDDGLGSFFAGKLGNELFVFRHGRVLVNDAQQFLARNLTVNVKLLNELQCSEHGVAAVLVPQSVRLLSSACTKIMSFRTQGQPGM